MTTHAQNFQIYKMSVPECLSNISYPEETFQASLRRAYILFDNIIKSQERLQTHLNSWISQYQISELQIYKLQT